VGLVVALFGIPLLGRLDVAAWLDATTTVAMLLTTLEKWLLAGALLALVVYWERRSVESIGLQLPGAREALAALGIGLGAVVLGLLATGVAVVTLGLDQPETLSTVSQLPLPVKVLLVLTAAVTEELLWRSYPIERLTELTGRLWVGAGVSAVVFLAVHFPDWGVAGAVPQAVFTLVLVGVYVWRRNVVTCMITHAVINVVMILLLPAFL
jgi:membrane protease YdiL (CAAX protease family)